MEFAIKTLAIGIYCIHIPSVLCNHGGLPHWMNSGFKPPGHPNHHENNVYPGSWNNHNTHLPHDPHVGNHVPPGKPNSHGQHGTLNNNRPNGPLNNHGSFNNHVPHGSNNHGPHGPFNNNWSGFHSNHGAPGQSNHNGHLGLNHGNQVQPNVDNVINVTANKPLFSIEIPQEFRNERREEYETWWHSFHDNLANCGMKHVKPRNPLLRIIGGRIATIESYPWMVSMYSELIEQPWCAGTLIASQWLITAAHCFLGPFSRTEFWSLHMGKTNASGFAEYEDEQIRGIQSVTTHPDFDELALEFEFDNDIALVKLDSPVEFNVHTSPLCLVRKSDHVTARTVVNGTCTITGYGLTSVTDVTREVNVLHEATVPLIENKVCAEYPGYGNKVTPNMLCAGFDMGAVDTCKGDSGGPLQCEIQGRWYHVGVTSWGGKDYRGCAAPHEPGVYTDISKYTDWIYTHIFNDYMDNL